MGGNDLVGQGQAQPKSPRMAGAGRVHPVKPLKQVGQVLRRDADACILDVDVTALALAFQAHLHCAAGGGVLQGIAQ